MSMGAALKYEPSEKAIAQRKLLETERKDRRRNWRLAEQDHFERTRVGGRLRPTEPTERKLQADPIERLHALGKRSDWRCGITGEQRDAAHEIRAVYQAVAGALLSRSGWPEGRVPGKGGGLSEWLAIAYHDRYKPWADSLSKRRTINGSPILEVTISIAALGQSCAEVDRDWHWREGKAADLLCEALAFYVRFMEGGRRRRKSA